VQPRSFSDVIAKKRRPETSYNLSIHLQYWTLCGYPVDVVAMGRQQYNRHSNGCSCAYSHHQKVPAAGKKRAVEGA